MKSKYTVLTEEELFDALEIAAECVLLWESYVRELETHNN